MTTIEVHILNAFEGESFCGFKGPWRGSGHWWVLPDQAKNATCEKCKVAMVAANANKDQTSPTTVQEV